MIRERAPAWEDTGEAVVITGENFRYTFDKYLAAFSSLSFNGRELLERPMEYNIMRAPIDNDRKVVNDWAACGIDRAYVSRVASVEASTVDGCASIKAVLYLGAIFMENLMEITAVYAVDRNGKIVASLDCSVKSPHCGPSPIRRPGFSCPRTSKAAKYFGYGPQESYIDKHHHTYRSKFTDNAANMYEDYIKPQENSSHYGCDYLTVTDLDGRGLRVEADKPFSFNLSEYTQEELGEQGPQLRAGKIRKSYPLR